MFDEGRIGSGKPKRDIVDRLSAVKQGHGNYRQAQDALAEINKLRKLDADKNRRIMELEARVLELERQIPRVAA